VRIIPRATERRLAVAAQARRLVSAGALFSYGVDSFSTGRDAARYADKILKGTSPADLPIEQATRFELVINRKVATAIGLPIAPALLQRADTIIE